MGGGASASANSGSESKSSSKSSVSNGIRNSPSPLQQDINSHKMIKKVTNILVASRHDDFIDNARDDEAYLGGYYDHHDNNDDIDVNDDNDALANAELYTHLTTSLDMESEDLLFNLLYFSQNDNQSIGNIGNMFNSAIEETVALHSENNTPYKLKPLPDDVINRLEYEIFHGYDNNTNDCLVCRDIIENGAEIIKIPTCLHSFHKECVSKWFKYQSSCPICRVDMFNLLSKIVVESDDICKNEHMIQVEEHKGL